MHKAIAASSIIYDQVFEGIHIAHALKMAIFPEDFLPDPGYSSIPGFPVCWL